jgi:hypothetical protein
MIKPPAHSRGFLFRGAEMLLRDFYIARLLEGVLASLPRSGPGASARRASSSAPSSLGCSGEPRLAASCYRSSASYVFAP